MTRSASHTDRRSGSVLRRRAPLLGGAALGGVAITGAPRITTASLREEDVRALNLLLLGGRLRGQLDLVAGVSDQRSRRAQLAAA